MADAHPNPEASLVISSLAYSAAIMVLASFVLFEMLKIRVSLDALSYFSIFSLGLLLITIAIVKIRQQFSRKGG